MLIIVGGLTLLAVTWVVSWDKYQEAKEAPGTSSDSEKKKSSKPIRFKRLPANGDKGQAPVQRPPIQSNFRPPIMLENISKRKPASFRPSESNLISTGNSTYSLVNNLKVVDVSERDNYSPEDIVQEKFNKLLVKSESGGSLGRAVLNQRTNQLGILTGVLKIKLHEHGQWVGLSEKFNLEEEAQFPGIRLSLLKTTDLDNIDSIYGQLKADPLVERVELEILVNPPRTK